MPRPGWEQSGEGSECSHPPATAKGVSSRESCCWTWANDGCGLAVYSLRSQVTHNHTRKRVTGCRAHFFQMTESAVPLWHRGGHSNGN